MIRIAPRKAPPPLPRLRPPALAAVSLATRAVSDTGPTATPDCARSGLLMAGEAA